MIYIIRSSPLLACVLVLPFVVLITVLSFLVGVLPYLVGSRAVLTAAKQMADWIALDVRHDGQAPRV